MKYFILLLYNSMSLPTLIQLDKEAIAAENKIIQEANQAIIDGYKRLDVANEVSAKIQELYKGMMTTHAKYVETQRDMATFSYHEPPTGQPRQLITYGSPLPRSTPIYWIPHQEITDTVESYRVLDSMGEDTQARGDATLFNTHTKSKVKINIQNLESIRNDDQTSGIGFTLTYIVLPSSGGGKSLYFKTKSTRKSSRRKYFKQKSSKRRIRTKSKYRRQ
jgi:hypothetical protein